MSGPKSTSLFASHGKSNGCVMVVEDEPAIRETLQMQLQETGYDVIGVENGEKAIEAIKLGENPLAIDVIITDVDNPKCMVAVNYFRQQFSTIPLIGLTGLAESEQPSVQRMNIVILGAGKGGLALLNLFSHLPGVVILGITDKFSTAVGLGRARELGIPVVDDPVRLIASEKTNLIVNVTGDPDMEQLIVEHKKPGTEVLGGAASKLLWEVATHDAQMKTHVFQTEQMANMVQKGIFVNYLVKPVQGENLVQSVARAIEQREIITY